MTPVTEMQCNNASQQLKEPETGEHYDEEFHIVLSNLIIMPPIRVIAAVAQTFQPCNELTI